MSVILGSFGGIALKPAMMERGSWNPLRNTSRNWTVQCAIHKCRLKHYCGNKKYIKMIQEKENSSLIRQMNYYYFLMIMDVLFSEIKRKETSSGLSSKACMSLMVRGCISATGIVGFHISKGTINTEGIYWFESNTHSQCFGTFYLDCTVKRHHWLDFLTDILLKLTFLHSFF